MNVVAVVCPKLFAGAAANGWEAPNDGAGVAVLLELPKAKVEEGV